MSLSHTRLSYLAVVVALGMIAFGVWTLERARSGVDITSQNIADTPATIYSAGDASGPLVVIVHGFSGARKMMQGFGLSLAKAGYTAVAIDLPGHGDNPEPMSANITEITGATVQFMGTLKRVIDALQEGTARPVALIGHSMATDIVIRYALDDPRVAGLVAVSMYSEVVTNTAPANLLMISGEYEPGLRETALRTLRLVDPAATENSIITRADGNVRRGALVAPHVEHVGVLYSPLTQRASLDWLDATFDRKSETAVVRIGGAIAAVLFGTILLFWPLTRLLPQNPRPPPATATPASGIIVPAVVTPLVLYPLKTDFLPMLGMSYLVVHIGLYGILTLIMLWRAGIRPAKFFLWPPALLIAFALGVFGFFLDRYFTNFTPTLVRLEVMAVIALGAVPFMLGDCLLLKTRQHSFWPRIVSRLAFFASVIAAIAMQPDDRLMLAFYLPVMVLYFLSYGLMARWVNARAQAPTGIGLAQGGLLAFVLGIAFPILG